ncbi:hypothetical protein F0562_008457 [Nyssa sinensis]|uniref:Homeobox domain-containing protein n=1 Tax=Nyssa sinensis TaxID=561372 RepID=A0A5J5A789_9ASTE|nr:hypothetical protein F0562_008457 [Nyssa sinensis]
MEGGSSEGEKKKPPEGENKAKRKMKTASQLEILEKTYAEEMYPSETLRAELSAKLGLSDRQLQMWFCHRRLKDRKLTPVKMLQKDASPAGAVASSSFVGDEMVVGEVGSEHASGSSPFGHLDSRQQRVVPRAGTALARIGAATPAIKRYYEPPQAISELRAIAFVEAQLGEPLRDDGPVLGMEFDPLPPGAFGAPIVTVGQQKPAGRPYEPKLYEQPDAKPVKGAARALHEYQFLPVQPSVRNDTYERAAPSHYFGSPTDVPSARTALSTARSFLHGSEQVTSVYGFQGQMPSLSLLPQQGRQGHLLSSVSEEQLTHDEDVLRIQRKRKNEEARIAREVEAHEKRIRKELEKHDILRRKREEQMRREMEKQDRERQKEEERLLREKQREEERCQREQRREMERRDKFLQRESIRAEKMRLKEELRRQKEAARLKAASDRATARRIAKESMELIEDERLELMELAASSRGLTSILALDGETLQALELFRDLLTEFPPKSVHLKRPFAIEPWIDSEENIGNLLMVWRFLITFADVLGLWPFTLDEFVQAFHDYDPRLLSEIHIALLRSIIKDIEDVARTPSNGLGANQNNAGNHGGGHPQIVEGAYAWGFDIRSWQRHLNPLTWPEILRQFALSAGFGPKLKKRCIEQAYLRDENEGNDEDIISNLRNGYAAENAAAIMQERGFSNPRRSRHRLTPGTVKFAAFHILSLEGSKGLTILEVADKIQKSGLRDLTTSKTPEASISAALSRDSKLFVRTAPSTYSVRAPYRKDPADAEAILSAAREKIQIFKNGYFEGEDADDAERNDAERDENSESDVAEDPEVDDLASDSKPNQEALSSCEANRFQAKTCPGNRKETSHDMGTPQHGFGNSGDGLPLMQSEGSEDVKCTSASVDQFIEGAGICNEVANPDQEDTVINESNSGELWVQGLMEGEYSDLSVEERLNAFVALIGVANEGNSIRIVLEERLEAANILKKQMWAEAQLDKRRMKVECATKIQYSSFVGNNAEPNLSIPAVEGRQSPLLAVNDKNDLVSMSPVVQQEHFLNPQNDLHYPNNMLSERTWPMQEYSASADNLLQQPGYAAEKSRSQLKAFIGHKAEEMYVYRSLPLGQDRRHNRYWQFITSASRNDPGCGRIFVELHDGFWRLIDSEEGFDALLASLDVRGVRESHLHSMLRRIELSFKETARRNLLIGLGRNNTEKSDALRRYQDFEKWMWEECFNSSILCAIKTFGTSFGCSTFSDHVDQCEDKLKGNPDWTLHSLDSSPPLRIRLLKAQLTLIEVSVLVEALQPSWSEDYRKSWGTKLHKSLLADDLLQVLTLLEGFIKRDFLSSNFETTNELLGSCTTNAAANNSPCPEMVSVLPWVPQTTSAVALRLMELDSSIAYLLHQKVELQKDKGAVDFITVPSKYAVVKNIPEDELAETPYKAQNLQQELWVNRGSENTSSGRGRGGRGQGRGCTRGGRSQRRVIASRFEVGRRSSTTNRERFGQSVGWKGRTRGRGCKRGRRTVRGRQKPVKRVVEISGQRDETEDMISEKTPRSSSQEWEEETLGMQMDAAENASTSERSEYDDDNGQATGDEFDDLVMDDYSRVFNGKSEHLQEVVDYNIDGGEDDEDCVAERDDDDDVEDGGSDSEEDEQGDIDVEGYINADSYEEGNRDDGGSTSSGDYND